MTADNIVCCELCHSEYALISLPHATVCFVCVKKAYIQYLAENGGQL